jgi:hypothetical protein
MDFSIPCLQLAEEEEDGHELRKVTAIDYKGNPLKPDVRLNDIKLQFVPHCISIPNTILLVQV